VAHGDSALGKRTFRQVYRKQKNCCIHNNYTVAYLLKTGFERISRELRESKQMLQRHISAALDVDNAMYCKIERGDRQARREQIPLIAEY
jgi:hypothetical protein